MSAISRRAAGLAAVLLCAGVLAGCAAPASESAAGPTPEPESLAASTTLDANRREPIDPEYLTQLAVAAERAANYWQTVLDENAIRYITTRVGMSGVVDPADDEEAADLLDNTDAGSGTDYRTKIDDGEAFLVKVSFYVVYSPEADYGGPQYPDGTNSIYVFTPVDDTRPCEAISGWYSTDSTAAIQTCKENLKIGKGDRSFPRTQAVLGLLSKARNKEMELEEVLRREAQHLLPHASDLVELGEAYRKYKREHALMDYDDLLFELEQLFIDKPDILQAQKLRFSQIMVDEYQDTNKVQARLVRMLAGEEGNIMAVGDDAQSIYAFRGATVHNILDFPKLFRNTRIIRLEENYRSVQPVLDIANSLLANTTEGYHKHLFSRRPVPSETAVTLYRPLSDKTQAQIVARRVEELLSAVPAREIAVLFRSGYQSYNVELELNKRGIGFRKYGGLRYAEAAHVKDVMAFARLVNNPLDLPSFDRIAALSRGIGPKTSRKLFSLACGDDEAALRKACSRWPDFLENMDLIADLRVPKT